MKKQSKRALADEAWLRNQQLEMSNMDAEQQRNVPHFAQVPETCTSCGRENRARMGWSLAFGDFLDCGNCGARISVEREAYTDYAQRLHQHHARLSWDRPKSSRGPRERGAG